MHPILAERRRLWLYLAAWFPVACLLAALMTLSGGLSWTEAVALAFPLALEYAFICLSSWYLCRVFPLQRTGFIRLFGIYTVAAFFSSTTWILIGKAYAFLVSLVPYFGRLNQQYAAEVPLLLAVGILLFYLASAIHYLMSTFESAREAERLALEHRILAREAELKALKAQIDPHFLFNSLNSVSALITTDAVGARKMCLLLADFLRKSITVGMHQTIPLAEELALASNFLAIERVRFGARLQIEQQVDETSRTCLMPPLLLQPLVENAVNHGIAHLIEGGTITISTERHGSRLKIAVVNPCDPDRPQSRGKGLGLQNVRNRLATLYGMEARVDIAESATRFCIELTIPATVDRARDKPDSGTRERNSLMTRASPR